LSGDIYNYSILVMDDDPFVLDVTSTMLRHFGFTVATCCRGEEACSLYREAAEIGCPFDLVILDLLVGDGMGGAAAAREILGKDANAKLIVSSGDLSSPVLADPKAHGFHGSLSKPFTYEWLMDALLSRCGGALPRDVAAKSGRENGF